MLLASGGQERRRGHVEQSHRDDRHDYPAHAAEGPAPDRQRREKRRAQHGPPNTTTEGGTCSMTMRMNKNELPQMTEATANSSSHRAGRREGQVNDS